MRITECYIENFGVLSKQRFTFNGGFSCFVADNGTGKTTLSVFIKAMLYGLGDGRRQDLTENERKRYLPWSGAVASGSLSFILGGKGYRIERTFGKKPSEDSFALYDLDTGLISRDYSERIGEEIFEINEGGFERTVFFSERNLPHDEDDGKIAAKLSDLSGVDADLAGFKGAMERLDEKRRSLLKRGGGGKIAELKSEISRYEKNLMAAEETRERKRRIEGELLAAKKKREELSARRTELLELSRNSAYTSRKSAPASNSRGGALAVFFMLFTLLSLIGAFAISPILYLPMALAFVASLLFLTKKRAPRTTVEDAHTTERELGEITERSIALERKIAILEGERERTDAYLGSSSSVKEEYERLREDYESAESELNTVRLAMEFLERARTSITAKYLGRTRELLSEYVGEIDGDGAPIPDMSTDFSLSVSEGAKTRDSDAYSKGTRRLYSFAAKLAFSESLYTGELPFIILDDPFVYLDDRRCKAALCLLAKISKKRQVIYFTASKSRGA